MSAPSRSISALLPPRVPAERPGKAGGKRDENRRAKLGSIAAAALPLYLQHGVTGVTVDQIVAAAGIAKGSFYRYFADQTELVATLLAPLGALIEGAIDRCFEALSQARTGDDLPRAYMQLAAGFPAAAVAHPDVLRLYLQEARSPGVGARAPIRALADHLRHQGVLLSEYAHGAGLLRAADPRIGALATIGAAEQLMFEYLSGTALGDPMTIPRELMSVILDGVRVRG